MSKQTIVLLSDLHIGHGPKESERTQILFDRVANSYPGVPVIVTGDMTDSAELPQFEEMRKRLDQLSLTNPVLTVPGNHDYAWKGILFIDDPWDDWVKYLGTPLGWGRREVHWMGVDYEPEGVDGLGVWEDGPLVYFGIDSGDPKDKEKMAIGYISRRLADALDQSLKNYANKTRIAMLHHHPFTDGLFTRLHGSARLMNALENNCELLLFGHKHKYGIWWERRGIPLIVSSHKSTKKVSGDCLLITFIDIDNAGSSEVSFTHRLETVQV